MSTLTRHELVKVRLYENLERLHLHEKLETHVQISDVLLVLKKYQNYQKWLKTI